MHRSLFSELQVSSEVKSAVEKIGLEKCSSLQAECIPLIKEGKDILATSQCASGIIEAYGIPAIDLVDTEKSEIQFLIIANDRKRVLEITSQLRTIAENSPVNVGCLFPDQPASLVERTLSTKPHILVSTLNLVVKCIDDEKVNFDELRTIVMDELSGLSENSSDEAVESLLESTTEDTQFVAFTRNDSESVLQIAEQFTEEYIQVSIEPVMDFDSPLKEEVYELGALGKLEALQRMLDFHDLKSGVIFTNSARSAHEASELLNLLGYRSTVLTAQKAANDKNDAMDYFNAGDLDFIVATDLGGADLDLDGLQEIIHLEMSHEIDDFTDRAKLCEKNILLITPNELDQLEVIESALKKSLRRFQLPQLESYAPPEENKLLDAIAAKVKRGNFKRRESLVKRVLESGGSSIDTIAALIDHAIDLQGKGRSNDDSRPQRKAPRQNNQGNQFRKSNQQKKPRPVSSQAMTQISLNVGYRDQIKPNHVVGAILGETGLSAECVGMIEIFDTNVHVEVAKEHSDLVMDRLNQTNINGIKIKAEPTHGGGNASSGKNFKDRGRDRDRGGNNRRGGGGFKKGNNQSYDKRSNDSQYYD